MKTRTVYTGNLNIGLSPYSVSQKQPFDSTYGLNSIQDICSALGSFYIDV